MGYLEALILGAVQGLTEFLPVSSSGHLVIVQYFMGLREAAENVTFDIVLHVATVLAVVWAYRGNISQIFTGGEVGEGEEKIPRIRLVAFLALSVVVTGVGFPFRDQLETMFENVSGVRVFLLVNALGLAVLPLLRRGEQGLGKLTWVGAIVIGLAQAVGAFPGISRSGATILAGLLLGLEPREAARYSFLLSIPTILIVAMVQIPEALEAGIRLPAGPVLMGFVTALAAGLVAIPLLVGLVVKGRLWGFAIYCAVLGIGLLAVT